MTTQDYETLLQVIAKIQLGKQQQQIANELGIANSTLSKLLRRNGLKFMQLKEVFAPPVNDEVLKATTPKDLADYLQALINKQRG